MLDAGDDARFIARRLVILASEDVGMADPQGLVVASAAAHAVELVGLPEAQLNLAHAVVYLATAPKSNRVTVALGAGPGGRADRGHQRRAAPPARRRLPGRPRPWATASATATLTTNPKAGSTSATGPTRWPTGATTSRRPSRLRGPPGRPLAAEPAPDDDENDDERRQRPRRRR